MKLRLVIAILSASVIFCALFPLGTSMLVYGQTTLANVINGCSIDWNATANTVKFAMIFNALPPSYYDTLIQQYVASGDWLDVFRVKRFCEMDGYDSATIEQATQQALSNMPMLENLPSTWTYNVTSYYSVYHRFILDAYRYAAQYDQTAKWDKSAAYQELLAVYQAAGRPSLGYNPLVNATFDWTPRYYDESAETLDSFIKLGGSDAGLWNYIQDHFWNGSIYGYSSPSTYECEVGFFAFVIGYYYAVSGRGLANFSRVFLDLYNKLLVSGWDSVAWGVPGVLQHASGNSQLRLENTLGAIQALQAYCGNSTWQSSFVNLLSGSTKAWNALLASPMYSASARRFKVHSDVGFSDDGTALGMMTLFLEGIIPSTGSLAMPLNDEGYQDVEGLSPASLFRFDYANTRIRIPVNPGELKFQFGTGVASYFFLSSGVYDVQFDSSWNTVTGVNKVAPLDSQFEYLATSTSLAPPPAYYQSSLGTSSTLAGSNGTFYCDWFPNANLSGFILSDNNTGTMTDEAWISFDSLGMGNSWSNASLILNDTGNEVIQWKFYANDTRNYWNDTMPLQNLTIRPRIHDIAVRGVVPSKTTVGQGFPLSVSVEVANLGDYPETVDVTAYANMTPVGPVSNVELVSSESSVVIFAWNTSTFDWGNYVMSAYAEPVPGETDLSNNNFTDGVVMVVAHDIAVTNMTFSSEYSPVNDTVTVCVTMQNNGGQTENFTVSVNCTLINETTIGTEPLTLAPEETATLNFTWIPTDVGLCTVKAYTSEIIGDQSPDDNTRIAFLSITSPNDVAVTSLTCGKTAVGQGFNCNGVSVTVANVGAFVEVFNVTFYVNMIADANLTCFAAFSNVSLNSGDSATLVFGWNTTGFLKGKYTLMAYAWPVPGDTDTWNNNLTSGLVFVSKVGDLTGSVAGVPDGKVDIRDIAVVAKAFGSTPGTAGWNANCDMTGPVLGVPDGRVDIRDIAIVAKHFGDSTQYP